jgi:NTE family protein
MSDEVKEAAQNPFNSREHKLGLALSGGGFRASLFHIGVLAKMAEMGLLRHVEVISTVSGGSIVGALYYLRIKKLLEQKDDSEIADEDYAGIIRQMEIEFLAAVQKNIRTRTFGNPWKNLRMALSNYSRSDRIGELYDDLIYRPAWGPDRSKRIEMRELLIRPKGAQENFYPRTDNGARQAKAPILIMNATTLNTGHNWRFEASRMGEPPMGRRVAQEVDKNMRLRRPPSYDDIVPRQQNIELGLAAAASACVPAIFHPLALSGLYDRGIRVQLVDGGVHDNQGLEALVDEKCTAFVVSDASGQLLDEQDSPTGALPVSSRSNDILMDRVREEELFNLLGAGRKHVAFMHLRKGLSAEAVAWLNKDGKSAAPPKRERTPGIPCESFGVDARVQDRLSKIRTDLDSFTDVEAWSLMLDGYLMSGAELPSVFPSPSPAAPRAWNFLQLRPWVATPTEPYLHHLEVAQELLFKVFRLSWTVTVVTALVVALLGWAVWRWFGEQILVWLNYKVPIKTLVTMAIVFALGFVPWASRTFKLLRFIQSPAEFLLRFVLRGLVPAAGSVLVCIHLLIFDRIFLHLGRVKRLKAP